MEKIKTLAVIILGIFLITGISYSLFMDENIIFSFLKFSGFLFLGLSVAAVNQMQKKILSGIRQCGEYPLHRVFCLG